MRRLQRCRGGVPLRGLPLPARLHVQRDPGLAGEEERFARESHRYRKDAMFALCQFSVEDCSTKASRSSSGYRSGGRASRQHSCSRTQGKLVNRGGTLN